MNSYPWNGVGMPLGGIGTGSVDFCPSGLFRQYLWMNNRPLGAGPELPKLRDGGFFGIQANGMSGCLFRPGEAVDWDEREALNDPYVMPFMHYPEVKAFDCLPMAKLAFRFAPDFPVKVGLTAWSPFIPHDVRNSSIPGAYFDFTLENLTDETIPVTLFEAQRNLESYTKAEELASTLVLKDNAIHLFRKEADPKAQDTGTISIGILSDDPKLKSSACVNGFTARDIWEPLHETGMFECCDRGGKVHEIGNVGAKYWHDPAKGLTLNALAGTFTLKPHEKKQLTFILAWHFPNQYERTYSWKKLPARRIGHYYNNFYASSAEVLADLAARHDDLKRRTFAFRKELEAVNMPAWLLPALTAQFATLRKSAWFDEKGNFAIWEGLGFCGLQTVDVSFYGSVAVLDLFPELELSALSLTGTHRDTDGTIGHSMPGNFHACDFNDLHRVDLLPDYLVLFWRDVCATGDLKFLHKFYPAACECLHLNESTLDEAHLPYHKGSDQTYDQFPMRGNGPMSASIYATGLAGLAELAEVMKDGKTAKKCRKDLAELLSAMEKRLWNGEYFSLCNDLPGKVRNEGVMVDQLVGEWARLEAGGSPLQDGKKVRSAQKAILRYCTEKEGYLRNCVWLKKNERTAFIGYWASNQIDWPWTGVEYAFAAFLERCGMSAEAAKVARDAFERYERAEMRYCHIECGPHYFRAMSIWAYYRALAGLSSNAIEGRISLSFKHFASPYLLQPKLRGTAKLEKKVVTLNLKEADFRLKELLVTLPDGQQKAWRSAAGIQLKKGKFEFTLS